MFVPISRARWARWLERLTRRQRGHFVDVTFEEPELGTHVRDRGCTLEEISYDPGRGMLSVKVHPAPRSKRVRVHDIDKPAVLAFEPSTAGRPSRLRIGYGSGAAIVRFLDR